MAKAKKNGAANGAGHNENGGMSDDDAAALTVHYQLKITESQRALDALLVDVAAARKTVNGHFKRMNADLQFTRKEFQADVLDKLNMTEVAFLNAERKRERLQRLAGLRQGEQLDFITHGLPDTVDDEIAAEADGYRAGRRADDPIPPKTIASIMVQAWMRGYHEGQAFNAKALGRAGEIVAAREAKGPGLQPGEDPDEEAEVELDPEEIDKKARKLRKAGWTEPTAEEAAFG